MAPRASLDLESGHVHIAARRVRVRAVDARGHLLVGDDGGPVLRPPTFGERTRLVASALGSAHPGRRLAAALVGALRTRHGTCDEAAERVVALLLAGAGDAGPPLVDTACLVARASGSSLDAVESLDATAVDFYARRLADASSEDDGWHRLVMADAAPPSHDDTGDDSIVMELAEVLLERARAWGSAELRDAAAAKGIDRELGHASTTLSMTPVDDAGPGPTEDFGRDTAPDQDADAATLRRHEIDRGSSGAARQVHASGTATTAAEPLLRYRQSPFTAATHIADRAVASSAGAHPGMSPIGASTPVPAAPSLATPPAPRVDANPHAWSAGPWRLDRRAPSALGVSPSVAPRMAVGWPTALPNVAAASPVTAPLVASHTTDEMADAVAESLRREAARRGMVP